jgi:hypothetical protein
MVDPRYSWVFRGYAKSRSGDKLDLPLLATEYIDVLRRSEPPMETWQVEQARQAVELFDFSFLRFSSLISLLPPVKSLRGWNPVNLVNPAKFSAGCVWIAEIHRPEAYGTLRSDRDWQSRLQRKCSEQSVKFV